MIIVGITGSIGCGKTYLARSYAKSLGIDDFYIINPVISDLKSMIELSVASENPVVMCIENLDDGVTQASYPLLKLIEDCPSHLYVVVTCCNLYGIPDTILSRCAVVTINPPTRSDIEQYAKSKDSAAYELRNKDRIWSCIKGFGDVDIVLKMTPEQLKYFNDLSGITQFNDTVSNISWKLQHYEDKTETPLALVIRYLMQILGPNDRRVCIDCLNDIADNKISKNAIISKLVFELKYTK
jgi:replication-associated recombination protein RarA